MTNKKISFDDAFKQLKETFPQHHNKILCNESVFKTKLRMLRHFYIHEPILSIVDKESSLPIIKKFSDFFFKEKDYITEFTYEHFCKRIEEFDLLLNDAISLNNLLPNNSDLVQITSVCPAIINQKRKEGIDNRLKLSELINKIDYIYINLPPKINMIQYHYCWLLGKYYDKDRIDKYDTNGNDFRNEYSLPLNSNWGYKSSVSVVSDEYNSRLFRIDNECFTIDLNNNRVSIDKVFINNDESISIDCIDGGVLTNLGFKSDFFYHIKEQLYVNFEDLYVVEDDAKKLLQQITQSNVNSFDSLTTDKQRLQIIKYALDNNLLDDYLDKENDIPVCNLTKKKLFEILMKNDELINKFGNNNRHLFSVRVEDFFKNNKKDIKLMFTFRSGRPKSKN